MTQRDGSARSKAGHSHTGSAARKDGAHAHAMPRSGAGAGDSTSASGMFWSVTTPQLASVTGITLLGLVAGMALPALVVNLRLGAHDVGPSIMPPGMVTGWDTSGDAMKDMSAVLPRNVTAIANADAHGDQTLAGTLENGVRTFSLTASVTRWTILPGVEVDAYAFNHQVPGPRIRVTEGERIRIHVHNDLPEATTIHWHGLILPNAMDGAAEITQPPIPPGGDYTYEFNALQAGTFFYHTHAHLDRQQSLGLYGALIIDPKVAAADLRADHEYVLLLQEWLQREGLTYPAMPMEGGLPNYFTINGKAYPSTDVVPMKVGETIRIRFIGSNNIFIHPMHIHGGPFTVVARDGVALAPAQRFDADTINVGPGQRYDVIWKARGPGRWLVHCHIGHHTTNNNSETKGGGGLMMILDVSG
jgi:FtsP/CotA-like multicopper oxidase with cupredoxin domain